MPLGEHDPPAEEQRTFEREWALNLLDQALDRLAREYPHYHAALEASFLERRPQEEVARVLGKSPADVRNYVFRAKRAS